MTWEIYLNVSIVQWGREGDKEKMWLVRVQIEAVLIIWHSTRTHVEVYTMVIHASCCTYCMPKLKALWDVWGCLGAGLYSSLTSLSKIFFPEKSLIDKLVWISILMQNQYGMSNSSGFGLISMCNIGRYEWLLETICYTACLCYTEALPNLACNFNFGVC